MTVQDREGSMRGLSLVDHHGAGSIDRTLIHRSAGRAIDVDRQRVLNIGPRGADRQSGTPGDRGTESQAGGRKAGTDITPGACEAIIESGDHHPSTIQKTADIGPRSSKRDVWAVQGDRFAESIAPSSVIDREIDHRVHGSPFGGQPEAPGPASFTKSSGRSHEEPIAIEHE